VSLIHVAPFSYMCPASFYLIQHWVWQMIFLTMFTQMFPSPGDAQNAIHHPLSYCHIRLSPANGKQAHRRKHNVQNHAEFNVTRNVEIRRLSVLPPEVQVGYWSSRYFQPAILHSPVLYFIVAVAGASGFYFINLTWLPSRITVRNHIGVAFVDLNVIRSGFLQQLWDWWW